MDLVLYRTPTLLPFRGNLKRYNTIFASNILFRAVVDPFPKMNRCFLFGQGSAPCQITESVIVKLVTACMCDRYTDRERACVSESVRVRAPH